MPTRSTSTTAQPSAPRKPRGGGSDNGWRMTRLKALPPQQRAEIYSWRDELPPLTNEQIRSRLRERFGIALKTDSRMTEFWNWQFEQFHLERKERLALVLEEFGERVSQHPELVPEFHRFKDRLYRALEALESPKTT